MIAIPLIIFIGVYLTVSVLALVFLAGRMDSPRRRRVVVGVAGVTLVLIPTADEIAGRIYLGHLCRSEGGDKVHRTVKLGPEYWDQGGAPNFYPSDAFLTQKPFLNARYQFLEGTARERLGIRRSSTRLVERETGQALVSRVYFVRDYGWLLSLAQPTALMNCPEPEFLRSGVDFVTRAFVKQ